MELMQLEMFIAVAEEHSVRKAADRVYRTQPAVSLALNKLEREIGTALLQRSRQHGCHLTQAGEALYTYASRIIGLRDEALHTLRHESGEMPSRRTAAANV
jgi:LysR family transcriptional regulator, low CO2-responsive transcriptional regulator